MIKQIINKIFERFPKFQSAHLPMQLGYRCGLRLGEAFALTWDDIDFKNRTLNVNKQVQMRKPHVINMQIGRLSKFISVTCKNLINNEAP